MAEETVTNVLTENAPEEVPADVVYAAFTGLIGTTPGDRGSFRRELRKVIKNEGLSYGVIKGVYSFGSCAIYLDDAGVISYTEDAPSVEMKTSAVTAPRSKRAGSKRKRNKAQAGIMSQGSAPLIDTDLLIEQMKELLIAEGFKYIEAPNTPFYCFDMPIYARYARTAEECWALIQAKVIHLKNVDLEQDREFALLNGQLLGFGPTR